MLFCHNFRAVLSKTNKLNLLVSLHEGVCIDLNFIFLSLSNGYPCIIFTMDNGYPVYNIPKLSLSLFLSLFLPLSKSFSLNANLWAFSSLFLNRIIKNVQKATSLILHNVWIVLGRKKTTPAYYKLNPSLFFSEKER